jgi:hypothetical protein
MYRSCDVSHGIGDMTCYSSGDFSSISTRMPTDVDSTSKPANVVAALVVVPETRNMPNTMWCFELLMVLPSKLRYVNHLTYTEMIKHVSC